MSTHGSPSIRQSLWQLGCLIAFCLAIGLPTQFAEGHEARRILIVIGYADDNAITGLKDLLRTTYYPGIALRTQRAIEALLQSHGFHLTSHGQFERSNGDRVDLLNANVSCPGETTDGSLPRVTVCAAQAQRSNNLMEFFNSGAWTQYDSFYSIGHARRGLGLGLGPFTREYTYRLKFYHPAEAGRLKRMVLASCDSVTYYGELERYVQLIGLEGRKTWLGDALPMLLGQLNTELAEIREASASN